MGTFSFFFQIALQSFCSFCGSLVLLTCIGLLTLGLLDIFGHYTIKFAETMSRNVRIVLRGWPPEHCDADGDLRE